MMTDSSDYDAIIAAPFGRLGIRTEKNHVVDVDLLSGSAPLRAPRERFTERVCRALAAYMSNPRRGFRLPLKLGGTVHQQRVWRALQCIPVGQVRRYGELAQRLKSSPRAIGAACRANPVAILVPCHRVVSRTGLGGFMGQRAGAALTIKRWLLAHEQQQ
jgi:methylated-DNA-[protein]-cysteine S-methyltransferase